MVSRARDTGVRCARCRTVTLCQCRSCGGGAWERRRLRSGVHLGGRGGTRGSGEGLVGLCLASLDTFGFTGGPASAAPGPLPPPAM